MKWNLASHHTLEYQLYYWREANEEVDFIVVQGNQMVAIEVKSGRRTNNEGLGEFKKRFKPDYSLVVGSGGVPIEEFLGWDLRRLIDDMDDSRINEDYGD